MEMKIKKRVFFLEKCNQIECRKSPMIYTNSEFEMGHVMQEVTEK